MINREGAVAQCRPVGVGEVPGDDRDLEIAVAPVLSTAAAGSGSERADEDKRRHCTPETSIHREFDLSLISTRVDQRELMSSV
ncbi:hypothetical protein AB0L63_18435 [Nocardia sp. NPDC051990]|uniref:hypothetical protein n=1 Tax=Nocardia sp. NPDC051990 TaxID=3155285 RepID=UPI00343D3DC2